MSTTDIETIVIGAGAVGLAIAARLSAAGQEVLVLERHAGIGMETSSRNSEVIHAGIYYPPGSLRARLCVAGKEMLYRYAAEHGVGASRCGKLLVATQESEIARLAAIEETAAKNGVADLVRLDAAAARALEPEVACVAGLLSPSTGIIDSHGLMLALEGELTARGGQVVLASAVDGIAFGEGWFRLNVTSEGASESFAITCRNLVIAAGLGATQLGRMIPYSRDYTVPGLYPAKGHYFALGCRAPFRHLVYPMPSGAWLGVHLTLDLGGKAKFGPDIEWCETIDYAFDDPDGARRARFEQEIRRYWPGLPDGALHPDYTGIRPKIYPEGAPAADFAIHGVREHGIGNLVALYGIESPGLTSSLAIGEYVASLFGVSGLGAPRLRVAGDGSPTARD